MLNITFLPEMATAFLLIFARIGTMIMLVPALGEISVPSRVRLVLALVLSATLFPVIGDTLPQTPASLMALAGLLVAEMLVGFLIGGVARLTMSALQVAGTTIAFQTGLAFAQNVDPTQGIQSALVGSFLAVLGVVMIFVTDLHYLLIVAMRDSYTLFVPGAPLPVEDFAKTAIQTVASAFELGIQLAAPFLMFGLVFYMALGILARLMPQLQIFFLALPANILLGFALFMVLLGAMSIAFLGHFEKTMMQFAV